MAQPSIITQSIGGSPNPDLVRILATLLAKARAGEVTDAVVVACSSDYSTEWVHYYSVREHEHMTTMIGELELFKDVIKSQVHQTRAKAAIIRSTGALSGSGD